MRQLKTLPVWLALASLHAALLALAAFTKIVEDTPLEAIGITALVVPYLLHHFGLPVLQNNGLGDGGWASPNVFGWCASIAAWLAIYWVIALMTSRFSRRRARTSGLKR